MSYGEVIRKLREQKGFTLEYVAKQVGISRQALCQIEKGHDRPSLRVDTALHEVYGTPTSLESFKGGLSDELSGVPEQD